MPHVPLKVLRGEQELEDVRDQHYERCQAPGTTTEDAEDDKDTDDDSRTSNDDVATEGREGYLGGSAGSIDSVIQFDNEIRSHQSQNTQDNPEYDTAESLNLGTVDVEAVAQVHHLPSRDDTENDSLSNDDTAPLLTNMN